MFFTNCFLTGFCRHSFLAISIRCILTGKYNHFYIINTGEESLTIFVDKRKLSKRSEGSETSTNSSSVTLETLHQLAASYFIDRDSTLRRLHHIQIASTAIKVSLNLSMNLEKYFPFPFFYPLFFPIFIILFIYIHIALGIPP